VLEVRRLVQNTALKARTEQFKNIRLRVETME